MCGFVATILPRGANKLSHRGPDGYGTTTELLHWANISVEMVRLAIVDRSSIKVPFDFRQSCGVVLAYNGELYNWRSLRGDLSDGIPWETNCDAEVIARSWRKWGPDMLARFNGMFGLCLIDTWTNNIFVARDRVGEKPLYYTPIGTGLAIASEIKALPIKFEECYCPELQTLEYDCLETTPFKDVKCLGPGEYLFLQRQTDLQNPKPVRWWSLPSSVDEDMSWECAVDETESLLIDAIKIRSACDVPVAVQLSGGLDSAIIQAVVQSERLYTVTFPDEGIDNLALAREASGGREPVAVSFGMLDLQRELPKIAWHLDTPATWSAVAQWFMNKEIANDGGVVVLSGEGADELFAGYSRYRFLWWLEQAAKDAKLSAYGPMYSNLFGSHADTLAKMLNRGGPDTLEHAKSLVNRFTCDEGLCRKAGRIDMSTSLQVLLRMADRMSSAFSLENRAPFFDYRLMELSARMPMQWKIDDHESKVVLRHVAHRLGVPKSITDENTKRGLFIPWQAWTGSKDWDRSGFATVMRKAWRDAFFNEKK